MQSQPSEPQPPCVSPRTGWQGRTPFFYGWVVVASVFFALAVTYGVYYSFSVFYVALLEAFGWSRGSTAGVFSLFVLVISVGGAASGALIDRFGPSRVVPTGGILLGLGLIATSRISELWEFYLYFGVFAGLGIALAGWVPAVTLVNRWFSAKRGRAMGIASAGIGLGTVAFVPFSQYLISGFGWREAFLVLAGLALVGIAPQAALLMMGRPEELGLKVDGGTEAATSGGPQKPTPARQLQAVDQKWAAYPWSVGSAVRTARFWFLWACFIFGVLTNQMLWVHQTAYLVDSGYDRMLAASIVGLAGLVSMPGKVMWGVAADRWGREQAYSLGVVTMVVAIGLLVLAGIAPGLWLALMFAVAFAVGYAVAAPVTPSAAADLFGGRNFGAIFGVLALANGLGGAFGAWLAGHIFDVTASYVGAFAVAAGSSILGAVSMWLAAPRKVRRVVRWPEGLEESRGLTTETRSTQR